MDMTRLDARWKDLPDYIIGVTRETWEARRIGSLHDHYADDIVVRSPASVVVGNRDVIGATLATLAEFPDRQLLGEDVIWADAGDGAISSHRLICSATHTGDGVYGRASGRRLLYRILADCHVADGRIDDEWLIRDQGAIVRQMGREPRDWAAELIEREGGAASCVAPLSPLTDRPGPYEGHGNDDPLGARLADIVTRIMAADLAAIPETYDRAVQCEYPGGITGYGTEAADRFWIGLRAAFPQADFRVEHVLGRDEDGMPPRAALRWSLWGRHSGWGAFGTPTGAMVYVLGITHAEFGPRGLRREWTLYDETAIWKQILLAQA